MASIKIFSLFVAIALHGQAVLGQSGSGSCTSKDFSQSVCGLVTFEGPKPVKFEGKPDLPLVMNFFPTYLNTTWVSVELNS
jgi:hypothetical protein